MIAMVDGILVTLSLLADLELLRQSIEKPT